MQQALFEAALIGTHPVTGDALASKLLPSLQGIPSADQKPAQAVPEKIRLKPAVCSLHLAIYQHMVHAKRHKGSNARLYGIEGLLYSTPKHGPENAEEVIGEPQVLAQQAGDDVAAIHKIVDPA